jgi:hypothetical protein
MLSSPFSAVRFVEELSRNTGIIRVFRIRALSAIRQALGGCDVLRVIEGDTLSFDKLYQPFPIAAHVALHFGERGKFFAFGLGDVLSRDLRPSLCALDVMPE